MNVHSQFVFEQTKNNHYYSFSVPATVPHVEALEILEMMKLQIKKLHKEALQIQEEQRQKAAEVKEQK